MSSYQLVSANDANRYRKLTAGQQSVMYYHAVPQTVAQPVVVQPSYVAPAAQPVVYVQPQQQHYVVQHPTYSAVQPVVQQVLTAPTYGYHTVASATPSFQAYHPGYY